MLGTPGYKNSIFLPHWRQAAGASSNAVKRRGTAGQTGRQPRADHRWQFPGYALDEACERHGGGPGASARIRNMLLEGRPVASPSLMAVILWENGRPTLALEVRPVRDEHAISCIVVPGNFDESDCQFFRLHVEFFVQRFGNALHRSPFLLDAASFQKRDLYVRHTSPERTSWW